MSLPYPVIDGDAYVDSFGVVWLYDAETDTYINKGYIRVVPLVDETRNGLVDPRLYDKVQFIAANRLDLVPFKLQFDQLPSPYFFLFGTTDKMVKIRTESETRLRLEVDRGMLYRRFQKIVCPGEAGDRGVEGNRGRPGRPAANEKRLTPTRISDVEVRIEKSVNVPIETPISARIFSNTGKQLAEILVETTGTLEGHYVIINDVEDFIVDEEKTSVELSDDATDSKLLKLDVWISTGTFPVGGYFKIRQQGPKGENGPDGRPVLSVSTKVINDEYLVADHAIINLRKATGSDDLIIAEAALSETVCVNGIKPSTGLPFGNVRGKVKTVENPIGRPYEPDAPGTPRAKQPTSMLATSIVEINNARWVAAQTTTRSCKDIVYFRFDPQVEELPLKIPQWTPMKQCADQRRYDMTQFDWQQFISDDPDALPFKIMTDPRPPEQCCAEDMWWCPNVGDTPCKIEGGFEAPQRFEEESCPCDCTPQPDLIEYRGSKTEKIYKCSINGRIDFYRQEISIDKASRTSIKVSITYGDFCDDYQRFQTECDLSTSVTAKCLTNSLILENDDVLSISGEGDGQYLVSGESGSLLVEISVNQLRSACCRGYDLQITVEPSSPSEG